MEQYSKAQIKRLIEVLEQQMATASGRAFDKMELARRDLKKWDGMGPLPHEETLRGMNIMDIITPVEQDVTEDRSNRETKHIIEVAIDEDDVQDADRAIGNEIRAHVLHFSRGCLKQAEEGVRSDNLPMLNDALVESQALLARVTDDPSLSDLVDEVQRTTKSIENLRRQTRDRLGVLASAEGQEKFREAYEAARALTERWSPPPTILKEDGTEQDLNTYWKHIRNEFVSWLRKKALDYVQDAQNVAKSYPELAHEKLSNALSILDDSALAREDGILLEPDKKLVQDEIAKIDQHIKKYKEAGDLVRKAQGYSRPSERKDLLLKAKQIFSSYPGLEILLADADVEYANELARIGMDATLEANHLAGQDKFDEALKKIADASSQITVAFPAPKKGTSLYQALSSLDTEKKNIFDQKNIYIAIESQLSDLTKYLKEYDEKKSDGSFQAARTMLELIQIEALQKDKLVEIFVWLERASNLLGKIYNEFEILRNLRKVLILNISDQIKIYKTEMSAAQSNEVGSLHAEKALLILDIDECLIHSSDDLLDPNAHFEAGGYNVIKRPFLDEFLENVTQWYDLAIWTGATEEYVKYICPKIIPEMAQLKFIWGRNHCTRKFDYERNENYWLKDIKKVEKLGYAQERILFVENDPRSLERNYGNMIRMIPFLGERHDEELKLLLRFLKGISKTENVKNVDKRNWRDTVI